MRPVAGVTAALGYGVGYVRTPRIGLIEPLHALDQVTGLTLCGSPVAMSWSPEDSAGTEIDCQRCLASIEQQERSC